MPTVRKKEKEINYSPISQTISPILAMRGPSIAEPGDKLYIRRRYQAWGRNWLLLQHSETEETQEAAIKWLSKRHDGVYVVLAPIHMIFDRSDMTDIEHSIAIVTGADTLRLLGENEIEALLPHLQAEVVGRRIWPQTSQSLVLDEDMRQVLGPFQLQSD